MTNSPGALPWAFGSPAERAAGGIMARLWMDTIFPYSGLIEPPDFPSWWNPSAPGAGGLYPGFHRNMRENSGAGEPNFTESPPAPISVGRPFDLVLLNTHGLMQSWEAPMRPHMKSYTEENAWPQSISGGAGYLLELYAERYLALNTRVIVVIPERDIMHIGMPPELVNEGPVPNFGSGVIAIKDFVGKALELLGNRLVGWFLMDEPDLRLLNKHLYATPNTLSVVRHYIREAEEEFAVAQEIEGWHRPCIVNFSGFWFSDPTAPQPEQFARPVGMERALDMAWMDRYPWRISKDQAAQIFEEGIDLTQEEEEIEKERSVFKAAWNATGLGEWVSNPIKTFSIFRELAKRVNPNTPLGSDDYIPVMDFLQTHGADYRVPNTDPGFAVSPAVEPDEPPVWVEFGTIKHARTLRRPTIEEARFEAWMSIFCGSEGLAYYMQTKVSDDLIWNVHRRVAHEISYFAGLRVDAPHILDDNLTKRIILSRNYSYPADVTSDPLSYMRPLVRIYRYRTPPGGGPEEYWMFILNRARAKLNLTLRMPHGVWRWGLQEYQYGDPFGDMFDMDQFTVRSNGVRQRGTTPNIVLPAMDQFSFRLYKGVQLR